MHEDRVSRWRAVMQIVVTVALFVNGGRRALGGGSQSDTTDERSGYGMARNSLL